MACNQIKDYIENGNIVNSVNFPCLSLERAAGTKRICVLSKNVEDIAKAVLAEVSGVAGSATKARGDYAYTIVDVTGDVDESKLTAIDGVLKVRVLG